MIKYLITKNNDLFDDEYCVSWINTVTHRKEDKGYYCSKTYHEALSKLIYIIKQQTAVSLNFIIKERRYVYEYYWKATTAREMETRQTYLKILDKIDVIIKDCYRLSFESIIEVIRLLSNTSLQTIIPAPGKSKHDDIKNKVEKIKEFYLNEAPEISQKFKSVQQVFQN